MGKPTLKMGFWLLGSILPCYFVLTLKVSVLKFGKKISPSKSAEKALEGLLLLLRALETEILSFECSSNQKNS